MQGRAGGGGGGKGGLTFAMLGWNAGAAGNSPSRSCCFQGTHFWLSFTPYKKVPCTGYTAARDNGCMQGIVHLLVAVAYVDLLVTAEFGVWGAEGRSTGVCLHPFPETGLIHSVHILYTAEGVVNFA